MIHDDIEVLSSLAQVAVAFAGFSAIVVLFRRNDTGRWYKVHRDRFHGMVVHATAAVFFCLLPMLVGLASRDAATIWDVSSVLLGIQITVHVTGVLVMGTTSGASRFVVAIGYLFVVLQALNVAGIGFDHEARPYVAGVIWHVIQSGALFVGLIWVPSSEVEGK